MGPKGDSLIYGLDYKCLLAFSCIVQSSFKGSVAPYNIHTLHPLEHPSDIHLILSRLFPKDGSKSNETDAIHSTQWLDMQ